MNTLWYFGLESVQSRYTHQLSQYWMPQAFQNVITATGADFSFVPLLPDPKLEIPADIQVGAVLDATGRSLVCLDQCAQFQRAIREGKVKKGDIIFLQDFWTPGIESIMYSLSLYGLTNVKIYAMVHAQSVDEYDFTYQMRSWMRSYEIGLCQWIRDNGGALFCASSCHVSHMVSGWASVNLPPVHVVSLPLGLEEVRSYVKGPLIPVNDREMKAVYSSRLDKEKRPEKFLAMAHLLISRGWEVTYTTSSEKLRANVDIIDQMETLEKESKGLFVIKVNQTKEQYYQTLAESRLQFNTSLQDYVSWTLLEACAMGCDILYPDFRSFTECVPLDRRYPSNVTLREDNTLLNRIRYIEANPRSHYEIAEQANLGRYLTALLTVKPSDQCYNIWTQHAANIDLIKLVGYPE